MKNRLHSLIVLCRCVGWPLPSPPTEAACRSTDVRVLMIAAIDSPTGTAHRAFTQARTPRASRKHFKATGPILIDVSTVKRYAQAWMQPSQGPSPGRRAVARPGHAAAPHRRLRHQLLPRRQAARSHLREEPRHVDPVLARSALLRPPRAQRCTRSADAGDGDLPRSRSFFLPGPRSGTTTVVAGTSTRTPSPRSFPPALPRSPPPQARGKPQRDTRAPELIEFEQLQKRLEEYRNIAIIRPTEDNVRRYMQLEAQVVRQASYFSDVAQRVAWATPDLDMTLQGRPVNSRAIEVFDREQAQSRKLSRWRSGAHARPVLLLPIGLPVLPRLRAHAGGLQARFGIQIVPISVDGKGLPNFPSSAATTASRAPCRSPRCRRIFLAEPFTGKITPIGFGVLSESQLVERIATVTAPGADAYVRRPSPAGSTCSRSRPCPFESSCAASVVDRARLPTRASQRRSLRRRPQRRGHQHVQQPRRDRQLHRARCVQGQTFNTYTGGNLYLRSPNKTYQLAAVQFPAAKGGCGGIDLFGGSFSHISARVPQHAAKHHGCVAGHRVPARARGRLSAPRRPDQVGEGPGDLDQQRARQLLRDRDRLWWRPPPMPSATTLSAPARSSPCRWARDDIDAAMRRCASDSTSILASARTSADPEHRAQAPFVGNFTWRRSRTSTPSTTRLARTGDEHRRRSDLLRLRRATGTLSTSVPASLPLLSCSMASPMPVAAT
jgi:conjugal transfer pilus assembly protein TraF